MSAGGYIQSKDVGEDEVSDVGLSGRGRFSQLLRFNSASAIWAIKLTCVV